MNFLEKFNIKLKNENLLKIALTHSSYANEHKGCKNYERLEFLGDAVLELVTSEGWRVRGEGSILGFRGWGWLVNSEEVNKGVDHAVPDFLSLRGRLGRSNPAG